MLEGERIDPGSFLARQLYSAPTRTKGIITSIARFLGIEANPDDRVRGPEWLDKVAFELMGFGQVKAGRVCCIYRRGRLMPLPNIERTSLQHRHNLLYLPGDEELACPTTPVPPLLLPDLVSLPSHPI